MQREVAAPAAHRDMKLIKLPIPVRTMTARPVPEQRSGGVGVGVKQSAVCLQVSAGICESQVVYLCKSIS